jgi:hypothetical protein
VTFLVDADGVLRVTAREQRTGAEASIQIVPSFGLSRDEVRRMMFDSIEHAQADYLAREAIEVRNKAEAMVRGTQKALLMAELPPDQTYAVHKALKALGKLCASGLTEAKDGYQLVGSAWLRWPVALAGRQVVECDYVVEGDFVPDFSVAMCVQENRLMLVAPTGGVQIFDVDRDVVEAVGGGARLVVSQLHKLRVEYDGKKTLVVTVDGKETARIGDVGRLVAGEVMLNVHSSTPVQIRRLAIRGKPMPHDPGQLRQRFVDGILKTLWQ